MTSVKVLDTSKINCLKTTPTCRYCSQCHWIRECPLAKQDENYKIPNPQRKCAYCGGNHTSRFQGCPKIIQIQVALREATLTNSEIRITKRKVNNPKKNQVEVQSHVRIMEARVNNIEKQIVKKCLDEGTIETEISLERKTQTPKEEVVTGKELTEVRENLRQMTKELANVNKEKIKL